MSDELRENVAKVLATAMGEIGDDVWKFYLKEADAAIAIVRNETLEEAAVVFDRYKNDPFTAAVVADHLRRMKGTT